MKAKKMCAWHPKYFGKPLTMREGPEEKTTHGICPACDRMLRVESGLPARPLNPGKGTT